MGSPEDSQASATSLPFPESLCHSCAAPPRYVTSDRGSVFIHCPILKLYPPQPVRVCEAYRPRTTRSEESPERSAPRAEMDLHRALEVAVAAAQEAGRILRAEFHRPGGARGRGDKARADAEAEERIRMRLLPAFPSWGYLGEETGRVGGDPGSPIWLVDPNDGTRDYLEGRRGSAVSIGLLIDRRPVLGVVFAFAYPDDDGDLFAWAEGCGSLRRKGRTVSFQLPASLAADDVVLVSSQADRDLETNLQCAEPARYRALPSVAHRLALVAAGEAAAATALTAPGAWDYAAGQALLRGSGGVLLDERGAEVGYGEDGSSRTLRVFAGSAPVAAEQARRGWGRVGERGGPGAGEPVRLRPGEAVADSALLSRAQGCLLGHVAGGSLGSLVKSVTAAEVAARHAHGPRRLEDGGVWGTLAGQPTADSEMALALARSILAEGTYNPAASLAVYRAWYRSVPFDVGAATRAALVGYLMRESAESGSLARVSPLGLFAHAVDAERAARWAREDSALTHSNPVCCDSVAAYVVALAHTVARGDGPEAAYHAALGWARRAGAEPAVVEAIEGAAEAPPVCDAESRAWVLVALRDAFFELLHAGSLEEGVIASVRRGGDAGVNGAVAGALLGAVHGREALPAQWRRMVLSCRAHPMRAKRPRPRACWPVDVLELAERLLLAGRAAIRS